MNNEEKKKHAEYMKKYYHSTKERKEKAKLANKLYWQNLSQEEKDKKLEIMRKNRKKNPDKYRNMKLKKQFGITIEQYNEMNKQQNGLCAICNNPETKIDFRTKKILPLCVDHSHSTGKIRKLLCSKCNLSLGGFQEDVYLLKSAIKYLEEN